MHYLLTTAGIALACLAAAIATLTPAGEAYAATVRLRPGELAAAAEEITDDGTPTLALTGSADIRDLKALHLIPSSYTRLDLSALQIVEYFDGMPQNGAQPHYAADCLPDTIFAGLDREALILPGSVTYIGKCILIGSDVKDLTLPSELTDIPDMALAGCQMLERVTLPPRLTDIGEYAFSGCGALGSLSFPKTLSRIGKGAFNGCASLTKADLGQTSISEVQPYTFSGCASLTSMTLPATTVMIGSHAFSGSGIETLDIPASASAGDFAFASMPELKNISIGSDQTSTGALFGCPSLQDIKARLSEIPDLMLAASPEASLDNITASAARIGDYAFAGSESGTLILGSELTSVGHSAFSGMKNLYLINASALGTNVPSLEFGALEGIDPSQITLYVAEDTEDTWRATDGWRRFKISSDISTTVDVSMPGNADVSICASAGTITVSSERLPLATITAYSTSGRTIASLTCGSTTCTFEAKPDADGIVIIKILFNTEEPSLTYKVMMR